MIKSDKQLIAEYLDGDEKSLNTLVDRYLLNVYNFALRLVGDRAAAEDITQESFIKAWKSIRGFKQGSSFQTWLFVITRNTAVDWLRKKKELTFSALEKEDGSNLIIETVADQGLSPDSALAQAEDTRLVQSILIELDPKYREVLTLRYSSELTFEQIGQILKKPLHTVKSQHHRAMIALRRSLRPSI